MAAVLSWACPKGRTESFSSDIRYGFVSEQTDKALAGL